MRRRHHFSIRQVPDSDGCISENIAGIGRPSASHVYQCPWRPAAASAWSILQQVKQFHSHVVCPVVAVLQQRSIHWQPTCCRLAQRCPASKRAGMKPWTDHECPHWAAAINSAFSQVDYKLRTEMHASFVFILPCFIVLPCVNSLMKFITTV